MELMARSKNELGIKQIYIKNVLIDIVTAAHALIVLPTWKLISFDTLKLDVWQRCMHNTSLAHLSTSSWL